MICAAPEATTLSLPMHAGKIYKGVEAKLKNSPASVR